MAQPKINSDQMAVPYDLIVSGQTGMADGTLIITFIAPRAFDVAANGHAGYAATAPSGAAAVITVKKNGSSFGTLTFNDASNSLSSETVGATSFAIDDRLDVELTTASSMEDFSITLSAETA